MDGQMRLFDFMPTMMVEPQVGEYVTEPGMVICHIMRPGYIGRKVLVNKSTVGMQIYQVGILENVIDIEGRDRSIVYTGQKQRQLITHYPGIEIYEVLPWEAYDRVNEYRRKEHGADELTGH